MKLTRGNWEEAAYEALLRAGPTAVAIVTLAEQLGATRGSFYHYFDSREQLLEIALSMWERQATDALIDEADLSSDPEARLSRLFSQVFREPTVLANAERQLTAERRANPTLEDVVARVTRRRKDYLTECYRDLGFDETEAQDRALLAYLIFVGWLHLDETNVTDAPERTQRLAAVVETLLLSPNDPSIAPA